MGKRTKKLPKYVRVNGVLYKQVKPEKATKIIHEAYMIEGAPDAAMSTYEDLRTWAYKECVAETAVAEYTTPSRYSYPKLSEAELAALLATPGELLTKELSEEE